MSVPTVVLCGPDAELSPRYEQVLLETGNSEAALEAVRHRLAGRLVIDETLLGPERAEALSMFVRSFYPECEVQVTAAGDGKGLPTEPERQTHTHCIVFGSVKGGSGATTIAVNIAAYLSGFDGLSVTLVDFARPVGDVHLYLNRTPAVTVVDCLPFVSEEDSDAVLQTTEQYGSLSVMHGISRPSLAELLEPDICSRIIKSLHRKASVVIVDAGHADSFAAHLVADHNRATLVAVAVPDIACLSRLGFGEPGTDSLRMLVLNKYEAEGGMTEHEIGRFVTGSPTVVRVTNEPGLVAHSWVSGRPLVQLRPDSKFAKDIAQLAEALLPAAVPADTGPDRVGIGKRLLGMVRK